MKAFVLCAGLGTRMRPVTERSPKALLPFHNVALLDHRLRALARHGIREVAVNLHHEGRQIVEHLEERAPESLSVRFFFEPEILGTGGALKNAEAFFEDGDVLVWNVDAQVDIDVAAASRAHRDSGALATLVTAENPDPARFTPLEIDGGELRGIGTPGDRPALFTGVSIVSARAIARMPRAAGSVVDLLWHPVLADGRDRIGAFFHAGSFFDLGTPAEFLLASLETLKAGGDFEAAQGVFDRERQLLSQEPPDPSWNVSGSVIGSVRIGAGSRIRDSVLWNGADVSEGATIERCLVGPARIGKGARFHDALLWPGPGGYAREFSLIHWRHRESPAEKNRR